MKCPSQKLAYRDAKRAGTNTSTGAGKLKPRNLFDAKHPKIRIHIPRVPRPNPEGFPDEKNGETRLNHAYKNGWIGKDFNREITPEPGYPGF